MRRDGGRSSWFHWRDSFGYLRLILAAGASSLDYVLLIVGTLAALAAGIPFPLLGILFGQLVDDLNSNSCDAAAQTDTESFTPAVSKKVILMIAIAVSNFVAIYVHATCWTLFGERLVGRLRRQYFKSLLVQNMAFFDTLPAGEVPTRLTTDIEVVRTGTSEKVGIFISSISYFAGAYIVAFLKVPPLAGMLTFMIPAYIIMVMVGGRFIGQLTGKTSDHLASAAALVSQALCNVDLVHSLGASRRLESKLVVTLSEAQRAGLKKAIAAAIQFGFMFLVAYSANALAFWQGSEEIASSIEGGSNKVTAGSVYTVIFVLLDASFVISQVAPFLQIFSAATAAAQNLLSVSKIVSETKDPSDQLPEKVDVSVESPEIAFQNVRFAYPARQEKDVLEDISLRLAPGKMTAIVGSSGSGKSTLAGLMTRLYEPDTGRILLGGTDIACMDIHDIRRYVGTLDQDPTLLCCSVLENLAFGVFSTGNEDLHRYSASGRLVEMAVAVRNGADFQTLLTHEPPVASILFSKIQAAAKLADASSFIESLPHGYASLLGPGGSSLSGGQKQRLALTRVLVKDPDVLVLDEATSSLDSISEQKILSALRASRAGKMTIAIAHRLGTIKDADHIIVMSQGRVMEQGNHKELLAMEGTYSSMTDSQSLQLPEIVSGEPSDVSTATISQPSEKVAYNTRRGSSRIRFGRRSSHRSVNGDQDSAHGVSLLRMVGRLARPRLLILVCGAIGAVVAGAAYSGDAVIFGHTIGHLDPCHGVRSVRSTGKLAGFLFFVLALAAFFANAIAGSCFGKVAEDIVLKMRVLTFRALFEKDLLWHTSNERSPAMLLAYFTKDTSALAGLSGVITGTVLTILVNLLASILMTHIIAWKIAVVLLATLPILLGSGFLRLHAIAKFQTRHQKLYSVSASISLEAVASIKTIASYSLEEEFYNRYAQSLKGPYNACLREFAYTNFWLATSYSVSTLIYALAYWWGAKQIAEGTISQTQFFIVLPALLFSAQSCGQMFALAPDFSTAKVAANRLFELIGASSQSSSTALRDPLVEGKEREVKDLEKVAESLATSPDQALTHAMAIELSHVSFTYPGRPSLPALKDISLSIAPGSFCAFVGPSGSGKSTMISLLSTLYMPTLGSVTFDGTPASPYHRSSIALVPQESTLFSDTIAFNIMLGAHPSKTPSQNDIETAAKAANIHDTITSLPQGYQTQTGPNASSFSGGQKQRLCIARALLRKPRLLLLDEPSSALDAEAENKLQETLSALRSGEDKVTIVVVAHRLCTIKRADRIFWVEDGEIKAVGTHEEMVRGCRGYRESAMFQSVG